MKIKLNSKILLHNTPKILSILLIVWAAFWLTWNAAKYTVTSDECVYGPVGVRMLLKGDMIMNNEHPPLNKILAGLFILPSRPNVETAYSTVRDNDQWKFGDVFLFQSGNNTAEIMFLSRIPTILLTLIVIISVWLWVGGYLGSWAAVGAVASLTLNPNIIANGSLTTNDMHLAVAAWFLFIATFNLLKDKKLPVSRYIWFGLAIGLVLVAKFSGIFFIGIAGLIGLVGLIARKIGTKQILKGIFVTFIVSLAMVWASYMMIEWRGILGSRTLTVAVPLKGDVQISNRLAKVAVVPFLRYKEGYNVVASHNVIGHNSYLDGKFSMEGFRNFFTKAIWYKTPTVLLLMAIIGFIWAVIKKKWVPLSLGLVGIVFVTLANYSHIHIGIRHVLPVYILFAPLAGYLLGEILTYKRNAAVVLLLILMIFWTSYDLYLNTPNGISYFSQISGGWREGYKHLSDSNTDWGQEMPLVADWVKQHPDKKVLIGYPCGEDPKYLGAKNFVRISDSGVKPVCEGLEDNQTLIVSVNIATGLFGSYPCIFDRIDKAERLGHTYLIFEPEDFR